VQAGAETTLILSSKKIALFSSDLRKKEPDQLFRLFFQGYDLIIGEGFKNSPCPKIEVLDPTQDTEPLCDEKDNLIALVSNKSIDSFIPVFSFGEIELLANLIEKQIAISRKE
jgi:molybdopterin-guanine dinucleotide biosynthesis protein B